MLHYGYTKEEWERFDVIKRCKAIRMYSERLEMEDNMKMNSLGCCKKASTPVCEYLLDYSTPATREVEKENNMNTSIQVAVNNEDTKRYLKDRLSLVTHEKRIALSRKFGMIDDEAPKTANELLKRIADGKFVVRKDRGDARCYGDPLCYINWRDPSVTKDEAGFDAANDKLERAGTAVKDQIVVLDPEKGLAALQAFEATEIS